MSGNTVTLVQQGACSITASQAGNSIYLPAAPVTRAFSVTGPTSALAQSITFFEVGNRRIGNGAFTISVSASSGLPVTLMLESTSACSLSGLTITPLAIGQCTLTATQPGNTTYQPAPPVTRSFNIIGNLDQGISIYTPVQSTSVSSGSITINYVSVSGLPINLSTSSPSVCTVSGFTVYLLSPGACNLTAIQPGAQHLGPRQQDRHHRDPPRHNAAATDAHLLGVAGSKPRDRSILYDRERDFFISTFVPHHHSGCLRCHE